MEDIYFSATHDLKMLFPGEWRSQKASDGHTSSLFREATRTKLLSSHTGTTAQRTIFRHQRLDSKYGKFH